MRTMTSHVVEAFVAFVAMDVWATTAATAHASVLAIFWSFDAQGKKIAPFVLAIAGTSTLLRWPKRAFFLTSIYTRKRRSELRARCSAVIVR